MKVKSAHCIHRTDMRKEMPTHGESTWARVSQIMYFITLRGDIKSTSRSRLCEDAVPYPMQENVMKRLQKQRLCEDARIFFFWTNCLFSNPYCSTDRTDCTAYLKAFSWCTAYPRVYLNTSCCFCYSGYYRP